MKSTNAALIVISSFEHIPLWTWVAPCHVVSTVSVEPQLLLKDNYVIDVGENMHQIPTPGQKIRTDTHTCTQFRPLAWQMRQHNNKYLSISSKSSCHYYCERIQSHHTRLFFFGLGVVSPRKEGNEMNKIQRISPPTDDMYAFHVNSYLADRDDMFPTGIGGGGIQTNNFWSLYQQLLTTCSQYIRLFSVSNDLLPEIKRERKRERESKKGATEEVQLFSHTNTYAHQPLFIPLLSQISSHAPKGLWQARKPLLLHFMSPGVMVEKKKEEIRVPSLRSDQVLVTSHHKGFFFSSLVVGFVVHLFYLQWRRTGHRRNKKKKKGYKGPSCLPSSYSSQTHKSMKRNSNLM